MKPSNELSFTAGQRWLSNPESELGLGIVSHIDHRYVTLTFPAAGEQRVYAKNNAPLSRVRFREGDTINDNDGGEITVTEISEDAGYITYHGADAEGNIESWGEVLLDCHVQFSKPQERLFAGQIDSLQNYQLRYQTLEHQHRLSGLQTTGLTGPRVELLPHQLYVAREVGRRFSPRVLLADEVGLGKTIEAGLIIHQQLITGLSQRVLIVVPETLVHQWLVEMLRRFNLHFTLLSAAYFEPPETDDLGVELEEEPLLENPFDSAQLILCSQQLLSDNPDILAQALATSWDLLVVDEAHHLEWHQDAPSPAYKAIEQLGGNANGLLLLTATPEQLGLDGHFARLRLLDPDRFFDFAEFQNEQAEYRQVSRVAEALLSDQPLEAALGSDDCLSIVAEWTEKGYFHAPEEDTSAAREHAVNQLLDCHGTGRVLFRNTRAAVQGFPERQLQRHPLTAAEQTHSDYSEDPKVQWLVNWLKEHRQDKVLIICGSPDVAQELETYLSLRGGIRSAIFYEGMSLIERDRAAAYFADLEFGAQVLVCSEIGSEGRNFQFSHHLIMFDLPLNPDLIEQRIGRLDRIGQRHTVNIHVPYIEGSRDEKILNWLHRGLNSFERVCPIGQQVYGEFAEALQTALDDDASLSPVIEETRNRTESLLAELKQGRDRLIELNSCRQQPAKQLVADVEAAEADASLHDFLASAFDLLGVEHEAQSTESLIIRPSDHMQIDRLPGLGDEGVTATLSRTQALSREDMMFLTWEHPMVDALMDIFENGERGNNCVCTIKLPPLPPGSLLLEGLFQFYCPAPRQLQLHRFTQSKVVRFLTDQQLRPLEGAVSGAQLDQLAKPVKTHMARQLVTRAREPLEMIVKHLEQRASDIEADLRVTARAQMQEYYDGEIERLEALQQINPSIRDEEIAHLRETAATSSERLGRASLRLSGLRMLINT